MDPPASSTRVFPAEWLIAAGLCGYALALYLGTLGQSPLPGLPAQTLLLHLGGAEAPPVQDALWGWLVRGLARWPGLRLAAWLNGLSAICGAACVGLTGWLMTRVRYRGTSVDAPAGRVFIEARARKLSAVVAGLYLAGCMPLWVASTRSLPATFHLLMLVLAAVLFALYQRSGKVRHLLALGLLYGVGMTEFPTFLLYFPVAVFLVYRDLARQRVLAQGRRHLAFWGGCLAGLTLYPVQAVLLARRLAAPGTGAACLHVLARIVQEQVEGLLLVRFNAGFIALMFLAIVPWIMLFLLSRRAPWYYDVDQILVRFVFSFALLAVLYNAPFAFWNFLGIHYLMLTPHLLLAACSGFMAGEFWILGGCALPTDASILRKRDPAVRPHFGAGAAPAGGGGRFGTGRWRMPGPSARLRSGPRDPEPPGRAGHRVQRRRAGRAVAPGGRRPPAAPDPDQRAADDLAGLSAPVGRPFSGRAPAGEPGERGFQPVSG
jgi:hypothetical protein